MFRANKNFSVWSWGQEFSPSKILDAYISAVIEISDLKLIRDEIGREKIVPELATELLQKERLKLEIGDINIDRFCPQVVNNDVNDILAANDYLFEQAQDSVNSLGDQIKGEGYFYLFVMIPLICLVGIGLFVSMINQYYKDAQNLFMITKVNHNQVHNIRNKISHFKNLLIQEEDIAAIDIEETYYKSRFDNAVNKYPKEQWSGNKETSGQRETKMSHLIKSYLLQSSKLLVIWILLTISL